MNFEVVYNNALKIYSKLYVGVKPSSQSETPLAFATPHTEDAAGLKRIETVKRWVGTSTYDYKTRKNVEFEPDLRVIDNVPMAGFKITDDVKRVYWGGGNVVWRLEHPLGWEIEIQSNNLMALIQSVGISVGGLVNGECILARDGATNVLIPINSEEYKNAIKAAESIKAPGKISMKDRVIGRFYRLANGEYCQYLGKLFVTTEQHDQHRGNMASVAIDGVDRKLEAYLNTYDIQPDAQQLECVLIPERELGNEFHKYTMAGEVRLYKAAPLIEELETETSLTAEEACEVANKFTMRFAGTKSDTPIFATIDKPLPHTIQYDYKRASSEDVAKAKKEAIQYAERAQEQHAEMLKHQAAYSTSQMSPEYLQPPTITLKDFLNNYGTDVSVLLSIDGEDAVVQRAESIRASNFHYRHLGSFIDLKPNDYRVFDIACKTLFSRDSRTEGRISSHSAMYNGTSSYALRGVVLETFQTIDELSKHIDDLEAAGRLVKICVKRIQG